MAIAPLSGIGPLPGVTPTGGAPGAPAPGFGAALERGLRSVSALEFNADAMIQDVATGGPTKVHELMVATTESAMAVDLLVNVRDRALEAYHEIMRLQL